MPMRAQSESNPLPKPVQVRFGPPPRPRSGIHIDRHGFLDLIGVAQTLFSGHLACHLRAVD